ncbi:hypothetical protein [Fictibacillus norfolkensis]|uniref:Uncharacterized protein n=1 Tax=Fictibacillus norfolkensis TaxID=2762233 RepID=A0ABR8SS94_9BACL|nr:hypothetical protein [Fictibacillus norfolkensis]MBD7966255.1 hypothetical protein [Fictibacillus norfolkensis]
MITKTKQIIEDLQGKQCQVFVLGNGVKSEYVAEVKKISEVEMFSKLTINFKGKGKPFLTLSDPYSFVRNQSKDELVYHFYSGEELNLIIGYKTEKEN